jgi:hypothetical protein
VVAGSPVVQARARELGQSRDPPARREPGVSDEIRGGSDPGHGLPLRRSVRLVEAAERLGEMLRSDNLETAIWADEVIKRHILPETSKHTSGLAGWYKPEPED